ncbi:hypothetical protein DZK25_04500 [Wenzhouxiangella sp. 15181]|nr:hypothetical protein DZK25_04500 [Wenzhouxiangella sp. 15181]RFP68062.1 hypothetical protein DZK26_09675 [Wenzhouxiangella sp. 15190]
MVIDAVGSYLDLPVRESSETEDDRQLFSAPQGAAESATTMIQPRDYAWTVTRDLAHDRSVLEIRKDKGEVRIDELDLDVRIRTVEWYSHSGNDYDSIRGKTENVRRLCRDEWSVTVRARTVLTLDAGHFYLRAELDGYEGDRRVHSHNIEKKIDRDLV